VTRSNRILNRVFVGLVGILLMCAAVLLVAKSVRRVLPGFLAWPGFSLRASGSLTVGELGTTAAIAIVVVVLCLFWVFTRGRGRISQLIVVDSTDTGGPADGLAGSVTIDARVAADLVSDALRSEPDVISVAAAGYRVRGASVLSLRVSARRGADLESVLSLTESAVMGIDAIFERELPVLLQVVSGLRANLSAETRTR
jgi:hypothetical protein